MLNQIENQSAWWAGRKIVVTGAAGFIGEAIVRRLLADKAAHIVAIDQDETLLRAKFDGLNTSTLQIAPCDLVKRNSGLAELIVKSDLVLHFAASTAMRWSDTDRNRDLNNGVIAAVNLLEAMVQSKVSSLVFSSSSAVYGSLASARDAIESDGPLLPISTYGAAKLAVEAWISAYSNRYKLTSRIIRFGNVVGAGFDRGVIYDVMNRIHSNPETVQIMGDGQQGRTYLTAIDACNALSVLLSASPSCTGTDVTNISGTGLVHSTDVIEMIAEGFNIPMPRIITEQQPEGWLGDVPVVRLNTQKIQNLGWQAPISKNAVRETIDSLIDSHLH